MADDEIVRLLTEIRDEFRRDSAWRKECSEEAARTNKAQMTRSLIISLIGLGVVAIIVVRLLTR